MNGEKYVELLFRAWSTVYDQPIFQKPFYRRVHAAVLRAVDAQDLTPEVVIDLGCGTAQLTADLAARYPVVCGVDLSAAMLAAARRRLGAAAPPLVQANVYALPLRDASVDLLTSTISYHWYLEPARALAEIHRVLRPGGRFVLATLASRVFQGTFGQTRWVSPARHAADLRAAGFTVLGEARVIPNVRVFTLARY
jgi:ubiquinone/menaquinone biosynthesis C-methylase UbiE